MKTPSHLDRHLQAHMEDKPYKCPYSGCQFSTKHKWSLQRHDIVHTKEKKFPCSICEYRAAAKFRLTKHMRSHGAGTNTNTTPTNKSFSTSQSSHSTHSTSHHKSSNLMSHHPPAATSRYEERPFHCHLCKYKGKTQSHLSRHLTMKVHNRPEKSQPHPQTDYKNTNNSQAVHMGGHGGTDATGTFAGFPASTLTNASTLFKVPVVPHCYPYGVAGNPYS